MTNCHLEFSYFFVFYGRFTFTQFTAREKQKEERQKQHYIESELKWLCTICLVRSCTGFSKSPVTLS